MSWPLVTTRSPSFTPFRIAAWSPLVGPVVTKRCTPTRPPLPDGPVLAPRPYRRSHRKDYRQPLSGAGSGSAGPRRHAPPPLHTSLAAGQAGVRDGGLNLDVPCFGVDLRADRAYRPGSCGPETRRWKQPDAARRQRPGAAAGADRNRDREDRGPGASRSCHRGSDTVRD